MSMMVDRRITFVVIVAVVAFGFWPSLFGGGSLVSADLVALAPPFDAHRPADFSLEVGPGDTIGIHAHWASLAADIRDGDVGWWTPDLAGGQPALKGGAPVFALPYLVVPDWYAPGLVAAVRMLTAMGLAVGFLRSVRLSWAASLTGAIAFGLSGFMVGWMNWPQSSVAAFAPGLLWAIEGILRDPKAWKAAPVGIMGALMVWASFPAVLIYVLLGSVVYGGIRLFATRDAVTARRLGRIGSVGALAAVTAGLLAGPFLLAFSEYLDWGDTSSRLGNPDDSSAGVGYLLSAVAPVWGSDAVGARWFGEGNWVEFNAHAGASVVALALFGIVAGIRSSDRRVRSVALGLAAMSLLGVVIAYLGGPVGVLLGKFTGPLGGLMTRAKVLWSIGIAFGAALGVERLVSAESLRSLRRDLLAAGAVAIAGLVVMTPSILNWFDAARGTGVLKETAAASVIPVLALSVVAGVVAARTYGRISPQLAGVLLAAVVTVELLVFMMPVPTTASRSERLTATPAHDVAVDALEPGERLGGEGSTFFVLTAQLFDIPDVRGQLLKSPGYQALLREVDPDMFRRVGGGTPTNPNVAIGTDPRLPVWRAMGVGAWSQFPDSLPIGTFLPSEPSSAVADPATESLVGRTTVPAGGLRAVEVGVFARNAGWLDVEISAGDASIQYRRRVEVHHESVSFAILGEDLPEDSPVTVVLRSEESFVDVGVGPDGSLALGRVAGDDDLELIRVGDVILFDVPAAPVRFAGGAIVEPDPAKAAALVAQGSTVVDSDIGLPAEGDVDPVHDVLFDTDKVVVLTTSNDDGLVVVPVSNYPGWSVEVDGIAAEIVTADAAFIGVPVPAGEHEVVFEFRPKRLGLGLASIFAGIVLASALVAPALWRRTLPIRTRHESGRDSS